MLWVYYKFLLSYMSTLFHSPQHVNTLFFFTVCIKLFKTRSVLLHNALKRWKKSILFTNLSFNLFHFFFQKKSYTFCYLIERNVNLAMKMILKWLFEIVAARKILQGKGSILTVKMDFLTQSLAKDLLLRQDENYTSKYNK